MENGHEGNLAEKLSGLGLNKSTASNDSLFQVMKAVEAAEVTIKQQVDENNRLRSELQRKNQELERLIKSHEPVTQRSHSLNSEEQVNGPNKVHQSVEPLGIHDERIMSMVNPSGVGSRLFINHEPKVSFENHNAASNAESHSNTNRINGTLKILPGGQMPVDYTGISQVSSPSSTPFSSSSEYDARLNLPGRALMQMGEVSNSNSLWKQDVAVKYQEHEEEIIQLRKYLADFTVKEAQVRNEKYTLEKRIAYMRLAFDQQQQDLVDAASKALSYRQDIIEENVRLTYELQAAQQERSTFVSSLLPLLSEYSLQPPVLDAQSIVSNIRILFRHLQEKLNHTESKVKEFQYQLAPWDHDIAQSNFALRSPSHPDAAFMTPNRNGLDLVPQPTYSPAQAHVSSTDSQVTADWDSQRHHHGGLGGAASKSLGQDVGNYSPHGTRGHIVHDSPGRSAQTRDEPQAAAIHGEDAPSRQVMFSETVSNSDMEDPDSEGNPGEREPSTAWGSGNSPYSASVNDPSSSYSPYLPPVLEEPFSSVSEAADDDPLPAINGLQISGEAFPGRELKASGYSINGTTSCNFEWVRHLEDGSVNYIDGAKQPNYLLTADDVDTYLAIEVQPLDDRKRKGELVKVFANEHRKITLDTEMQNSIEETLSSGHASYKVSLPTAYIDIWEPATLSIKKEGYSIKSSGASGVSVTDKFLPNTSINIPYGQANVFVIITSNGSEHLLRVDSSTDNSSLRDTVVLTFRLFMIRAAERRKRKKKGIFF